jgi:hypothetical protein
MSITNKAITTQFLNIIIRKSHGQTEIIIQYGGLRSSVMCVTTSCSNDSFASPTHIPNQSLDKGYCSIRAQVRYAAHVVFSLDFGGSEHVYRAHPINIQLVTDPVLMPAKAEYGYDSGS